jgi:hypothetical protein
MVESSLYREFRDANPDRFRVGKRSAPITDHLGRIKNHPCFGCIVDTNLKDACKRCLNEDEPEGLVQATLKF